jgi:hypothetical protein
MKIRKLKSFKNLGTKVKKIREQKFIKIWEKNYRNPKTKIWEQKLQKSGNKTYKIWEQKLQDSGNKNPGTKISKIEEQKLKIWEQIPGMKISKSGNKNLKIEEQKLEKSEN